MGIRAVRTLIGNAQPEPQAEPIDQWEQQPMQMANLNVIGNGHTTETEPTVHAANARFAGGNIGTAQPGAMGALGGGFGFGLPITQGQPAGSFGGTPNILQQPSGNMQQDPLQQPMPGTNRSTTCRTEGSTYRRSECGQNRSTKWKTKPCGQNRSTKCKTKRTT